MDTNNLKQKMVKLCCGGKNCPILTQIDSDTFTITDDDLNTIQIKKNQLEMIAEVLKEFN